MSIIKEINIYIYNDNIKKSFYSNNWSWICGFRLFPL